MHKWKEKKKKGWEVPQEIHPHLELAKKPTCIISPKTFGGNIRSKKIPCFLYGKSNTFALSFSLDLFFFAFFRNEILTRARLTHSLLLLFLLLFPPFFSDDRSWENEVGPRKNPLNVSPFRNEEERKRSPSYSNMFDHEGKKWAEQIFFFCPEKKSGGKCRVGRRPPKK